MWGLGTVSGTLHTLNSYLLDAVSGLAGKGHPHLSFLSLEGR